MPILNKDMTLCISLAARPSNIGTRFHNYLYEKLGLNYVYKAFAPVNIEDAVRGIRGLPIRGAAVSMPYKEAVIPLIDQVDRSAAVIESVNTIVNDSGTLTGYNTDYLAIERLLKDHRIPTDYTVLLQGAGGMAKAVAAALANVGFRSVTIVARNEVAGRALAARHNFTWIATADEPEDLIINVTPLGMQGSEEDALAFPQEVVARAKTVFDVVALPALTPLIRAAQELGIPVITGAEVIAIQAEEQFVLYTGVRPEPELVREASEFSRSE